MGKLLFVLHVFKRIFFLFALFLLLFMQSYLIVYIENLVSCFPITIITTQKEHVEQAVSSLKVCSVSVQSERMTFDSSIFNHYETLPVKEIYLYSMKIPYSDWGGVKNMEDVITEANPYIEDLVSVYTDSKIKIWLVSFLLFVLSGIYFVFRIVAAKQMSKKQFVAVSLIISMLYVVCSVLLFCSFPTLILPLSAVSAGVLFAAYTSVSLITYKLSKW